MTIKNEQGRSMVEMLGVLAVMGVLSVGGVAMYTNAMNKYRANELLNESSKRAVVIATQILSGKSVSSDMINQFDNNGTTFTGVEAVGTNQFKLTLSGVDDDVCTQLKATAGSNTIIQEVGDKCAYLTFNNDLSKGTTSSGTGGGTGGSGQQEPVVDLCANYDAQCCNNGDITSTAVCNYNNGTNNGLCSNGICQQITYTCEMVYSYPKVTNALTSEEQYCLGGCKSAATTSSRWLDICETEVPEGSYMCSLHDFYSYGPSPNSWIYDSNGLVVSNCAQGCSGGTAVYQVFPSCNTGGG